MDDKMYTGKCAGGCGANVTIHQYTIDTAQGLNGILARLGEKALKMSELVWCDSCYAVIRAARQERAEQERAQQAKIAHQLAAQRKAREDGRGF